MVVWYVTEQCQSKSEQTSPFRRWTTGSGAGSSYRQHDHRNIYSKQMSEGGSGVSGASGGVARWSLGLEQLLADPAGAAAFAHFLAKEFAAENIRFWWSCEQYSRSSAAGRESLAAEIWARHLCDGAPEPVNVDAAARRAASQRLQHRPLPDDLFLQAQKQIFNVMKFDSYPRFLRSGVHAECARADLRGLPPPYGAPAPAAPPAAGDATPTKLKKSASNASERRRSGGASLLPWKLRGASRERAASQTDRSERSEKSDRNERTEPPPLADVVKAGTPGANALCRVVLPDGATSVVGVEEGVPVRRLVDRLLQRRNLPVLSYDVLLRDEEGSWRAIEVGASSLTLAGREARVERRVVLRLAVGGRLLAVRCRAARPLRHVLRPVLRRRAPAAVLRAGRPLHPDTPAHELDGALLEIVELCDGAEAVEVRDDDADSLSDLAVRLQDDSEQLSVSCRNGSECGSVAGVGSGAGSNSSVSTASSGSAGAAGAPAGGAAGGAGERGGAGARCAACGSAAAPPPPGVPGEPAREAASAPRAAHAAAAAAQAGSPRCAHPRLSKTNLALLEYSSKSNHSHRGHKTLQLFSVARCYKVQYSVRVGGVNADRGVMSLQCVNDK
ncbi:unnamed protein product [Parnassius apollo]|uniref:(apollo) hypothetical protein n=1 Tax=Parnassius apollo TaxID=110799 RepID=A0A8S3YB54_PARAO|nr:unnamed protein product [Parnassius apollo]